MASFLRQIVAGPRAKHAETGLDLCYVTPNIIATSGPSQTYPKRAYRNPLDRLVAFLDAKHGDNWAIWEFRAEGTGYPDDAVYGRIRHYPWPDHHPPPFRLVPIIMASMRNWHDGGSLDGGRFDGGKFDGGGKLDGGKSDAGALDGGTPDAGALDGGTPDGPKAAAHKSSTSPPAAADCKEQEDPAPAAPARVVVVHCKAGKGRSGTMAVSYLVTECGWAAADALARFTERRMRPRFGAGVSIPSQLRWISYVERWAATADWQQQQKQQQPPQQQPPQQRHHRSRERRYLDRPVEIVEVHAWGLRSGVKVEIGAFADEGKRIVTAHVFRDRERIVVEGDDGPREADVAADAGGERNKVPRRAETEGAEAAVTTGGGPDGADSPDGEEPGRVSSAPEVPVPGPVGPTEERLLSKAKPRMAATPQPGSGSGPSSSSSSLLSLAKLPMSPARASTTTLAADPLPTAGADVTEPGGQAVVLKPAVPVRIPNSDVLIRLERRSRAPRSVGLTMVTAAAHAWFNVFFEGGGPERPDGPEDSGVFEIAWEAMDGVRGSSRKGARAVDRLAVVWRAVGAAEAVPAPQMEAADWRVAGEDGEGDGGAGGGQDEGETPGLGARRWSASDDGATGDRPGQEEKKEGQQEGRQGVGVDVGVADTVLGTAAAAADEALAIPRGSEPGVEAVKSSGPMGEDELDGDDDDSENANGARGGDGVSDRRSDGK